MGVEAFGRRTALFLNRGKCGSTNEIQDPFGPAVNAGDE